MKILLMHQTVAKHDGVGTDITSICQTLEDVGDCVVYADYCFDDALTYVNEDSAVQILADPGNLVIYHHSVFWEKGERLLRGAKARIVVRYHNITPREFFAPYDDFAESQCRLGREQTQRLIQELKDAFWLCDSHYNSRDITGVPRERMAVCPPFHKTESWAAGEPDEGVMKTLLFSEQINLLFVGRVAPNKGHLFLLDVVQAFRVNYSQDIHLWIIGKFDESLKGYNDQIRARIDAYGLQNNVHFVGELNDGIMSAYYLGCDFFVCASEHEGFCIPLAEAQYFQLPILAKRSSAIPETLGPDQLIFGDDPRTYAAAIHTLYGNGDYTRWLRERGKENYTKRFAYGVIQASLRDALRRWGLI